MISITKRLEFDAGHRIPYHKGKCNNLHGHRYILNINIAGMINKNINDSDYGMIMDFSEIKSIAKKNLIDLWDHAFLVYVEDKIILNFLQSIPNHKTVILNRVPTVENLAQIIYHILAPLYNEAFHHSLFLQNIILYETPTSWAEYSCKNINKCNLV